MKKSLALSAFLTFILSLISLTAFAIQPTACITSAFNFSGSSSWAEISLRLTNNCGIPVDFQNANIRFINAANLNGSSFWGNFDPLSYPDNNLQFIGQSNSSGGFVTSFNLHFPEQAWANTVLQKGQSFTILFGAPTASYDPGSVRVFLNGAQPITGNITVQVSPQPAALQGYTGTPTVNFTPETGTAISQVLPWNRATTIGQLANNTNYTLTTAVINYNGNNCSGSFSPATVISNAQTPPTSFLNFQCVTKAKVTIPISIKGLPTTLTSLALTFTPTSQDAPVTTTIPIKYGNGSGTVNLNEGVSYAVSGPSVSGYSASFVPQPLIARANATESVNYQRVTFTGGRVIGYLPGWVTPPSAATLANAGYTHMLVAFGVFSTTAPGQIANAFSTVTPAYIASLHQAGIKVSLSIGGASSSLPDTTVNFHQVLSSATSPANFQATMVESLETLFTQYGFDGVDIDIEQGFNAGGTFSQPQGDIAVLAAIINKLHADNPALLISLAPQVANISATSGFSETWGNYASLIMQTAPALSWVGIQLYNTGCAYGIDKICYDPNAINSPNFAVAMATDLLVNWPSTTEEGQATGFQPYISKLNPSQVVIGFPAPDAQGNGDGAPVTPISTIKRAIQCLRTRIAGSNSCDTAIAPQAYPNFGGVFDWEVIHDQSNNYQFAGGLKACVLTGNCN